MNWHAALYVLGGGCFCYTIANALVTDLRYNLYSPWPARITFAAGVLFIAVAVL